MDHKPLDLEEHSGETRVQVWTRRIVFAFLIALCVSFAAPQFGSCSGAFGTGDGKVAGRFTVAGKDVEVGEEEFHRFVNRMRAVWQLLNPGAELQTDDFWADLILDHAAKAEGIHVSDEQIASLLRKLPEFQTAGEFDEKKYAAAERTFLSTMGIDHEGLTAGIRTLLRGSVYRSVWLTAFEVPESRRAYDEWKKQNVKVNAEYVVQEYEPLRAEAVKMPVTEDDLRAAQPLPEVKKILAIPARRGIEAAYAFVDGVSPEQRAKMEAFVRSIGVLKQEEENALAILAWQQFWANCKAGGIYSKESWSAWQGRLYDVVVKEWEAKPEASRGEKPKDPRAEPWPEKPQDQFDKLWIDRIACEVLIRETLRHMVLRAERESKSLSDLLPDYEAMGVRIVATQEPLPDDQLVERFPLGLAKDSELGPAIVRVRMPEPGTEFSPRYVTEPAPTTVLNFFPEKRGFAVARIHSWEPAKTREALDPEVRSKVEDYVRAHRASDLAIAALKAMKKSVEEAGEDVEKRRAELQKLAAAAHLEVRTLRGFNARTPKPAPAADPKGEAAIAAAAKAKHRNRVLDDYPVLSKQKAGAVRDPILSDDSTGAAYLILVAGTYEPSAIEMDDTTRRIQQMILSRQGQGTAMQALSAKEVAKRFRLTLTEAPAKPE